MKNVDDLITNAGELADAGLSSGEIADELNVSRETASWLVERSGVKPEERGVGPGLRDIHIDWSTIGRDSTRLSYIGKAIADLLMKEGEEVDLTVGIERVGVPLATVVAQEMDTDLSIYAPARLYWEEDQADEQDGRFSRNYASIRERECYLVDKGIDTGATMTETIEAVREKGGEPAACCVIVDKKGVDEIKGVPVYSLLNLVSVGEQP